MKRNLQIGIIVPNKDKCSTDVYKFAFDLGRLLAVNCYNVITGGKGGVMEGVFKGIKTTKNAGAITVGIIPEEDKEFANEYCDIIIPSGVGTARNKIIINTSDIVIAIAGGAGTLSEIAFAWQMNKPVLAYSEFEGWAKELAGKTLDNQSTRHIIKVNSLEEIIQTINHITKNPLNKSQGDYYII